MITEEAERLVVGVRGEGVPGCAGLLAPDLPTVGGVDLLGVIAQDRHLLLREAVGQEEIALFSELTEPLRGKLHRDFLPTTMGTGSPRRGGQFAALSRRRR